MTSKARRTLEIATTPAQRRNAAEICEALTTAILQTLRETAIHDEPSDGDFNVQLYRISGYYCLSLIAATIQDKTSSGKGETAIAREMEGSSDTAANTLSLFSFSISENAAQQGYSPFCRPE